MSRGFARARSSAILGLAALATTMASCLGDPGDPVDTSASADSDHVVVDTSVPFDVGDTVAPPPWEAPAPFDSGPYVPPDGAPLDAGDPPVTPCDADASTDTPSCALPPSKCVDATFLVYYVNSTCVEGRCHWEKRFLACPRGCSSGACTSKGTAI